MGEKNLVVDGLTVSYEGYFHCNDLNRLIRRFTESRGYDPKDVMHEVKVKEDGRYIVLDLRPDKKVSDYAKFIVQTKIAMNKVTDAEIEIDGKKVKINHGSVKVVINGYLMTDYEGDWQSSPRAVFMKLLFDKFIYKRHVDDLQGMLKTDCNNLRNEISSFLNLHKYIKSYD